MPKTLTLLHDGRADEIALANPSRPTIPEAALGSMLGWELQLEGSAGEPCASPLTRMPSSARTASTCGFSRMRSSAPS